MFPSAEGARVFFRMFKTTGLTRVGCMCCKCNWAFKKTAYEQCRNHDCTTEVLVNHNHNILHQWSSTWGSGCQIIWWKHASHVTPAGVVSRDVWEPLSYINRATEVQYVLIASDKITIASLKAWVTWWMLKKLLYFYPFFTYSSDRPTCFYSVGRRTQFPYLGKSKSISLQFWYKTVSIWKVLYKYEIKVVHTDCLNNCCKNSFQTGFWYFLKLTDDVTWLWNKNLNYCYPTRIKPTLNQN